MEKPAWVKMKEDELKKIIADLAKEHSPAKVGLILRDQYGIPTTKLYGKRLKQYLKEAGIEKNHELESAEKKLENLKAHLKNNITDRKAKHKMQKAQSKLNKLKKYYSKKSKE